MAELSDEGMRKIIDEIYGGDELDVTRVVDLTSKLFKVKCRGGKQVVMSYTRFDQGEMSGERKRPEPPVTCVALSDPRFNLRDPQIIDSSNTSHKKLGETLIDRTCEQFGCDQGRDCYLKRPGQSGVRVRWGR